MWTLRVAVAVGGIGVDANLRILQLAAPVSLKLPTGSEEWLDDRRTRGVAELRKETPYRGAILVGARGGLGVNRSADVLGEFPTEPVTREAHPYPPQVRARRTSHDRRLAQGRAVAVQGQYLQRCTSGYAPGSCTSFQFCGNLAM
ncbi:hypothetical protein Taro_031172 [Colocasia esculenta]|uniref:Uncharacterized protein n=1 Tax=Colocasia esculenta TaxID=4460 RepID=A0A843VPB8_COLES|nr:hypothetical protein [Colocasia esculenta]